MRGTGQILIVEDDMGVRESLAEYLEAEGYLVATASNGREGLRLLQGPLPSVVILDLHMPVLSGEQFVATIRSDERLSGLPVVLMSGDGRQGASTQLAVQAVLPKPFEIDELLDLVERLSAQA
jgi:two-component system response regulator VicR